MTRHSIRRRELLSTKARNECFGHHGGKDYSGVERSGVGEREGKQKRRRRVVPNFSVCVTHDRPTEEKPNAQLARGGFLRSSVGCCPFWALIFALSPSRLVYSRRDVLFSNPNSIYRPSERRLPLLWVVVRGSRASCLSFSGRFDLDTRPHLTSSSIPM